MLGWIRQRLAPRADALGQVEPDPAAAGPPPGAATGLIDSKEFVSDEPIGGAVDDRFNRAPFATRIADTIARRPDSSSLVVGLFGPWGDGKTSVLKMMEEELALHQHVVVVYFNPWHFQSEEQLIRGFFATLSDALERKLHNAKERLGSVLKDYGSLLSLGSLTVGGVVQLRPGDAAKGLGEAMSNVSLNELRSRIEGFLAESGKRVVVLVDDIDRLDRTETHSMFKLVKLSASFKHMSYVLAFDDEVVSAALGERYGAGGHQAGRAFLEKIIQVPLHLPPIDDVSLRVLAFEGVQAALNMAEIQLSQADADAFSSYFIGGLDRALTTPRVAKLYTNALMFALPLLKGEVNVMNLLLIEAVRVFYPTLYAVIRDNPGVFLSAHRREMRNMETVPTLFDEVVDQALGSLSAREREDIKDRLLHQLFPRTGRTNYASSWDAVWAKEQRICAPDYFARYFSYCVPDGEVSDASVELLLLVLPHLDAAGKRSKIEAFARRRALPRLVSVLRRQATELEPAAAAAAAEAIAASGDLMPKERGAVSFESTFGQAGILIENLIKRIPEKGPRWLTIQTVLETAIPVSFAAETLRWLRHQEESDGDPNVVDVEDNALMDRIVAARIVAAHALNPIYVQFPKEAAGLFWLWDRVEPGVPGRSLRELFDARPREVDAFLASFVPESRSVETGLTVPGTLRRETYDALTRFVDGDYLLSKLILKFGAELDDAQRYPPDDWAPERRFSHQFARIHAYVKEQSESESSAD